MFRNNAQYYARFVDVNSTPTAKTIVSFNINAIIYNRTTDENGTGKPNINLPSGEYILTATNTVTGEKISNVIKVLSVIESSNLIKYFRNASQFIVRIHTLMVVMSVQTKKLNSTPTAYFIIGQLTVMVWQN